MTAQQKIGDHRERDTHDDLRIGLQGYGTTHQVQEMVCRSGDVFLLLVLALRFTGSTWELSPCRVYQSLPY